MEDEPSKKSERKGPGRRPVATRDKVKDASELLESEGLTPSGRAIIDLVGGSSTTVNKLIGDLYPDRKKLKPDTHVPDYLVQSLGRFMKEKTAEMRQDHLLEKKDLTEKNKLLTAVIDDMSKRLKDVESNRDGLRGAADGAKGRLEQETASHAQTRGDLQTALGQVVDHKLHVQRLEQMLKESEERFQPVKAERDTLMSQCADQKKSIEEQRGRAVVLERDLNDQRGRNAELTGQLRSEKEANEQTKQKLEATQAQLMTKTEACTRAESEHEQSLKEAQHYQGLAEELTRQLKESQKEGGECREKLARTEGQLEREITRRES